MDQIAVVEDRIADGSRFVERFAADGNPVLAAFWVKTAEDGLWFLYVATEIIDRVVPAAAYRAVHDSLQKLDEPRVASSEIKVVGPNNPVARDVLAVLARRPSRTGTRFDDRSLGSLEVEQTYIYPPHLFTVSQTNPMTSEDISREILRLMNRGSGIVHPSRIALKDGTTFNGVPFSVELGPQRAMVVRLVADGEPAPRVIRLDEIASIG